MEKNTININGVEIIIATKDGREYLPIKPICEAIGVDFAAQYNKIKEHPILSSTIAIIATVGADGRAREMVCLPERFYYGWLFSINPEEVIPGLRDGFDCFLRLCYRVLYNYTDQCFAEFIAALSRETSLLKEINAAIATEKEARAHRQDLEERLALLRCERLSHKSRLQV